MNFAEPNLPVVSPEVPGPEQFTDARAAVERLGELYGTAVDFLRDRFTETLTGGRPAARFRAFYPEIRLTTTSFDQVDRRLSFGHVGSPGTYSTTITRPGPVPQLPDPADRPSDRRTTASRSPSARPTRRSRCISPWRTTPA